METDCSGFALGGCLSQVDREGRLRPISYFSLRLSSAEVNYPIHDKELLSIIACLKEWRAELNSVAKPFTILSDHKNLSYFTTQRLLNELQRPGHKSERPDALSRRDQDKIRGIDDERTSGRILRLLPPIPIHPVSTRSSSNKQKLQIDQAALANLFEDKNVQALWKMGVECDKDWPRARDAVSAGE